MSLNDLIRDQYKSYANLRVNNVVCDGDLAVRSNAGVATLSGGTATVTCANVLAGSTILLSFAEAAAAGADPLGVTAITPGASFAVASNGSAAETFYWLVLN